jgi:hypothetical protein
MENKVKEMKGEILTVFPAIATFCRATIIRIVGRNPVRGAFGRNPDDRLGPLAVNPEIVFDQIAISESSLA